MIFFLFFFLLETNFQVYINMIQISLRVNSNLLRMQIYSTTKFSRLVLNVKYNRVLRIKILTFIKKKKPWRTLLQNFTLKVGKRIWNKRNLQLVSLFPKKKKKETRRKKLSTNNSFLSHDQLPLRRLSSF